MGWFGSKALAEPFMILGEVPDGAPGKETAPALRAAIPPDKVHEVLSVARDVILTATGPMDGMSSAIAVKSFDSAIRAYMPLGHYERSPNQAISVLDYKVHACRLVHRLLNQITRSRITVGGAYNSHVATNARAKALYEALLDVAAHYEVPQFTRTGWASRLSQVQERKAREVERLREDEARRQKAVEADHARRLRAEAEHRAQVEAIEQRARVQAQRAENDRLQRVREEMEARLRQEVGAAERRARQEAQVEVARLAREREAIEERVRQEVERRLLEATRNQEASVAVPRPTAEEGWAAAFDDLGVRRVFSHLAHHGSITEFEITGFLGSPRAYRRFALEFERHAEAAPFRVRIEAGPDGKRYVKQGER